MIKNVIGMRMFTLIGRGRSGLWIKNEKYCIFNTSIMTNGLIFTLCVASKGVQIRKLQSTAKGPG